MGELAPAAAVSVVTALFSLVVGRQWWRRRRPYQAAWLVALVMATVAALSYVLFLLLGRPAILFRLYYLFGAALNVAFLGLGSLYLAIRRPLRPLVVALVVASVLTAGAIFAAPLNSVLLATTTGAGTDVLGKSGLWLPLLIIMNSFGTVCLVGVALRSAWSTWRHGGVANRAVANVVIAAGALTIAGAGTFARLAGASGFWLLMLAGWVVMFAGFLLANRAHARAPVVTGPALAGRREAGVRA